MSVFKITINTHKLFILQPMKASAICQRLAADSPWINLRWLLHNSKEYKISLDPSLKCCQP